MSITNRNHCFHLVCSVGLLVACSGDVISNPTTPANDTHSAAPDDVEQQLASLTQNLTPSDAVIGSSGPSYFELRRDGRRCAAPLCGGFFVSRVNRLTTACVDGSRSDECYVSALDFAALGLSERDQQLVLASPEDFLLQGEIVPESTEFGELGRLNVTEAWQGHAQIDASGAFLRVTSLGIACITNPCPSLSAQILNIRLPAVTVAELDLEGIGSDPSDALEQLNEPDGLLVAALPEIVSGPGGRAIGLDASEYYVPLTPPAACGSRGLPECAADSFCAFPAEADCGRSDKPGTCAPKPEICTFQFDPVCGCDGQTYGNACTAAAAGVSVEFAGECPASD